jgi:hypothetical protein
MEVKSKVNLPDLPPSEDEFWDGDKHLCTPEAVNSDGPHYFEHVTGHEAYCGHCGWGFALDRGDHVRDGHVFNNEEQLVI